MSSETYSAYHLHYARMLNQRPSLQITDKHIESYRKPWLGEIHRDTRILDVGCGMGHQLFILKKLGYRQLHGIEITKTSLDVAREELGEDVELILADAFEYLPRVPQRFGCIICNDVLEHIPRERTIEFLQLIHGALQRGGIVVLRVPNMASLLAQYSMYLDFTHVVGFTEFSLMQVLDIAGFENHCVIYPERRINWKEWRLQRPLSNLGITAIANDWLHRLLYRLRGQTPMPTVFDYNIEIYSHKP
jgi:2-polyprenyl-3-methyl-5-hydroxy-6-metoxy-1,4-benzoquinol methylase